MGNAYIMGIAPDKGLILRIVKNPGILTQHGFYQCPDTEPFNLPADVFETIESGFFYSNQVNHAIERIKILRNLPHS